METQRRQQRRGAPAVSTVIGAAGGTVIGPNGASVVIPPGALATEHHDHDRSRPRLAHQRCPAGLTRPRPDVRVHAARHDLRGAGDDDAAVRSGVGDPAAPGRRSTRPTRRTSGSE